VVVVVVAVVVAVVVVLTDLPSTRTKLRLTTGRRVPEWDKDTMGYQDIPGRNVMRPIFDLALAQTPTGGVWVEVGCALGRGIAEMARVLIDAGRDDVTLYAVDPWGGYGRNGEQAANGAATRHGDWALFLENMQANAPEELRRIHIVRAPSVVAATMFYATRPLDLCILDGDHTFDAVDSDIVAWLPRMRIGGIIGGDDHTDEHHPGVRQACEKRFGPAPQGYNVSDDNAAKWPIWWTVIL
jgi:hypothetical protein